MSGQHTLPLILVGLGNVGGTLLHQILTTREAVARRTGLTVVPVALADISGVVARPDGFPDETLRAVLDSVRQRRLLVDALPGDVRPLSELESLLRAGTVLVDVTAATGSSELLHAALKAGGGVAIANKNPLTGAWPSTRDLFTHPHMRYECTVGAGLPVIRTLRSLLDTGDQAARIEGCMSGTLGYLCAELERGIPYSQVIAQARALGYTEPDPRDDLSGHDVARKALILARTAGWPLEMSDLVGEPLYPAALASLSVEGFLEAASSLDDDYAERFAQAQAQGATLRYVAQVGPQGGTVGLKIVPADSPLGTLRGPANYIALTTERYHDLPLVIAGPGAGPVVTAAGVLGDILDLGAAHLG